MIDTSFKTQTYNVSILCKLPKECFIDCYSNKTVDLLDATHFIFNECFAKYHQIIPRFQETFVNVMLDFHFTFFSWHIAIELKNLLIPHNCPGL